MSGLTSMNVWMIFVMFDKHNIDPGVGVRGYESNTWCALDSTVKCENLMIVCISSVFISQVCGHDNWIT